VLSASLEPVARSVTLVHRRAAFRAHEYTVSRLLASTVEVITDAEVTAVSGQDRVTSVEITSKAHGAHTRPAQAVIAALGCRQVDQARRAAAARPRGPWCRGGSMRR
jgi:ferredoxin/flavodoxin---NADP+ reductase